MASPENERFTGYFSAPCRKYKLNRFSVQLFRNIRVSGVRICKHLLVISRRRTRLILRSPSERVIGLKHSKSLAMQTKALRAAGDQAGDDLRCTFCGKDNRETLSIRL